MVCIYTKCISFFQKLRYLALSFFSYCSTLFSRHSRRGNALFSPRNLLAIFEKETKIKNKTNENIHRRASRFVVPLSRNDALNDLNAKSDYLLADGSTLEITPPHCPKLTVAFAPSTYMFSPFALFVIQLLFLFSIMLMLLSRSRPRC